MHFMSFEIVDSVFTITLDNVATMTLAAIVLLIGVALRGQVGFLTKFCIPAPVVGGTLFAILNVCFTLTNTVSFNLDASLQNVFMLAFFTTVGLGASLRVLVTGGKLFIIYWLVNVVITVMQTGIGVGVGSLVGLEAAYGLVSGPIALVGGHGGATAYGETFQGMGYEGAQLVGLTAATFGLVVANLTGGPLGRRLIERYHLQPSQDSSFSVDISDYEQTKKVELNYNNVMKNLTAVFVCMTLGSLIVTWIGGIIGMSIPTYVGSMFFAVIVRNLNDHFHFYEFSLGLNDNVSAVSLGLYLSMAMITMNLLDLADLAAPLLVVLVVQCVVLIILTYFVIFRILGKNYDAAVMCAGLIGHDIGSTPTAMANMTTIQTRYGESKKAMIIVPIIGAFLIDVFYQPFVIWFINAYVPNLAA